MSFVDEEGDLFVLKVEESILLMHRVASKVVAQNHVPVQAVLFVKEFLEVFSHLNHH